MSQFVMRHAQKILLSRATDMCKTRPGHTLTKTRSSMEALPKLASSTGHCQASCHSSASNLESWHSIPGCVIYSSAHMADMSKEWWLQTPAQLIAVHSAKVITRSTHQQDRSTTLPPDLPACIPSRRAPQLPRQH